MNHNDFDQDEDGKFDAFQKLRDLAYDRFKSQDDQDAYVVDAMVAVFGMSEDEVIQWLAEADEQQTGHDEDYFSKYGQGPYRKPAWDNSEE